MIEQDPSTHYQNSSHLIIMIDHESIMYLDPSTQYPSTRCQNISYSIESCSTHQLSNKNVQTRSLRLFLLDQDRTALINSMYKMFRFDHYDRKLINSYTNISIVNDCAPVSETYIIDQLLYDSINRAPVSQSTPSWSTLMQSYRSLTIVPQSHRQHRVD